MKVMCIGSSAYDITSVIDDYPVENSKYKIKEQYECAGGSCGNAATLLSKWGIDTYYVGCIGNDYYGNKIKEDYINRGVNIDYLVLDNTFKTTTSYILVNKKNGSRTIFSFNSFHDEEIDINVDIEPDIILLDGREYETAKKIIEKYKNAIKVIDAGNDRFEVKDLSKKCNYVVCSKEFMQKVSGININNLSNIKDAFNKLEDMFNTNIIVTLESDGCAYKKDNKIVVIPTLQVEAKDTTGAGDIFHGAFVYGLTQNWDLEKCLKIANIAGSLSVTKYGGRNSIFSLEEVLEVYNEIK